MTVREISEYFDIDRSTITRHIATLNIKSLSEKLSMSTASYPVNFDSEDLSLIFNGLKKRTGRKSLEQHGMSFSREYSIWRGMKRRCYNQRKPSYKRYGGRGITVCSRWNNSFMAFYNDMGSLPFREAQIDRIDNDGNYEPSNCRWTTRLVNIRNSSSTKINFKDACEIRILACMKMPQKDISKEYNICYQRVSVISRLKAWEYKDSEGRYFV